jgi:hypothetical protein
VRKIWEALGLTLVYFSVLGAAVLLRAPDLAMAALLLLVPLLLLFLVRSDLTLLQKVGAGGVLPVFIPTVMFFIWNFQFPGRSAYVLVAALCASIYLLCLGSLVNLRMLKRYRKRAKT